MNTVSCIMPVCGRFQYTQRAIEYFLHQQMPPDMEAELIIIDDHDAKTWPVVKPHIGSWDDPYPVVQIGMAYNRQQSGLMIRYYYMPETYPQECGEKMNLGNEMAHGDLRIAWNDDDWYAPTRIRSYMEHARNGADLFWADDIDFLRIDTLEFLKPRKTSWWYTNKQFGLGSALAYTRKVWDSGARYAPLAYGDEAVFIQEALDRGFKIQRVPDKGLLLYIRHDGHGYRMAKGRTILDPIEQPEYLPDYDFRFYYKLHEELQCQR